MRYLVCVGVGLLGVLGSAGGCTATPAARGAEWAPAAQGEAGPAPVAEPRHRVQGQPWAGPKPRGLFHADVGIGTLSHKTKGPDPNLDDDVSARQLKIGYEGGPRFSGGFSLELISGANDELHGTADAHFWDFYGYFLAVIDGGRRFRMPIRIGPSIDYIKVDDVGAFSNPAGDDLTTLMLGVRVAVEPEVHIILTNEVSLGAYATVYGGFGTALLDDDDETYDSNGYNVGGETGLRFNAKRFHFGVAYVLRRIHIDRSDEAFNLFASVRQREAEYGYSGVAISAGVRW